MTFVQIAGALIVLAGIWCWIRLERWVLGLILAIVGVGVFLGALHGGVNF